MSELDLVFRAISDPTRRKILDLVRAKARTTGEIAEAFDMSRIGVMKHMSVLENAGLLVTRKEGRVRWNHLNAVPLRRVYERWVSRYESEAAGSLLELARIAEGKKGKRNMSQENVGMFHIEQEVGIDAPRERVWKALTEDIDAWWMHRTSEGPSKLSVDARLGGLFIEEDEHGGGGVWGTVMRIKKNEQLMLSGALGMSRPVSAVYEYRLEEAKKGTLLKLSHRVVGDLDPSWESNYTEGWKALFDQLKRFIEKGDRLA